MRLEDSLHGVWEFEGKPFASGIWGSGSWTMPLCILVDFIMLYVHFV